MDKKRIEYLAKHPELLYNISPREFEEIIAELLSSFNWDVKLTPPTRDGGYDILAVSSDASKLETSWLIECKRYSPKNKVGVSIIRELYGVKEYLGISNGVIVTTSNFTNDSKKFAELKDDINLVDFDFVVNWLKEYKAPKTEEKHLKEDPFHSCFVSHSHKDQEFAEYLTSRLRQNGIKTWFAPDDLNPGQKIHEEIHKAINIFDKLIIVLSPNSMNSEWVISEIRKARKREIKEGSRVLFPIALCSFEEIQNWECFDSDSGKDLAVELREYLIPQIDNWKNKSKFESFFNKMLKGLKQ